MHPVAQRVLIVGAGLGGLRTAEQLRSRGYTGHLLLLGDETHLPYNRPPLSKEALRGGLEPARLAYRHRLDADDVEWRLGQPVVGADLDAHTVQLESGDQLDYDALVAASGASARRLAYPHGRGERHVVRTLEDAARLGRRLQPKARVVVIGAGFIGCEVAATARDLGCEVDVVDPLPAPMARPLGVLVGAELQRRHEQHGVRFHLGRSLVDIVVSSPPQLTAVLDDGTSLTGSVLVEAVGSIPNVSWLRGNGLNLTDGVLTDSWLRPLTDDGPVEGVGVVGDIARFPNVLFDDVPRRVEHWNIPTETAKRAAQAMALALGLQGSTTGGPQEPVPFAPVPAFWSDQFGVRLQSFGLPGLGQDDVRLLEGNLSGEFAVGYHRNDRLVGVVLVGSVQRHLHYRRLIAGAGRPPDPRAL